MNATPTNPAFRPAPRAAGFSIVEVLVVLIILGVLAAAMGPRLSTFIGRGTKAAADNAAGVLSAAARRDTLTSQRVAVEFDGESAWLRLVVFDPDASLWRPDPLIPPADLTGVRLERASLDAANLDPANWRVEFPQNQSRGVLALCITDPAGRDPFVVTLGSRATRAVVAPGFAGPADDGPGVVDLDETGRGQQAW